MVFSNPSTTVRFSKYVLHSTNKAELKSLINDIFVKQIYRAPIHTRNPEIIDAGAHVGTAALYFSTRHQEARITCIEPHPTTLQFLHHNLHQNHLPGVTVINAALAKERGERSFFMDSSTDQWFSTAGFINTSWNHAQVSKEIRVPTISLASLLKKPIDLLKLDIEGAEEEVIAATLSKLHLIRHAIIECHKPSAPHRLTKLFSSTHTTTIAYSDPNLPILTATLR